MEKQIKKSCYTFNLFTKLNKYNVLYYRRFLYEMSGFLFMRHTKVFFFLQINVLRFAQYLRYHDLMTGTRGKDL